MATSGIALNPYDEVPYPSQPLPQTHPDHLASLALLFGMEPAPIHQCRVLELGCATGGNLLPMAERLSGSQFVGIDYSGAQITEAQRAATHLGITNAELRHADIAELGDQLGQFDYIICHGVFSWVPPAIQEKILSICKRSLSPQGVAYVSYNIYPGWQSRSVIREMMLRHAPAEMGSNDRLARGRKLLSFFSKALELEGSSASKLLKADIDGILPQPETYIYHEFFEGDNRPMYFHEFAEQAGRFGLQYLSEAAVATMFVSNFGPRAEQYLRELQMGLIAGEQHLDLLRNRAFRQTLLVHDNHRLVRHITTEQIKKLYFSGLVAPESPVPDLKSQAVERFKSSRGAAIGTPSPVLKAALYQLHRQWPRASSFDELVASIGELLDRPQIAPEERQALGSNLIQCLANGLLDINSAADDFVTMVSERPQAAARARHEAAAGQRVTNRRHTLIDLDDSSRKVLTYLDGTRDRESIVRDLVQLAERGDVSVLVGGIPLTGAATADAMRTQLDSSLNHLAKCALLIA